jgi:hypothetical protein
MMFAQSFLDFGFSEGVLHIVRIIASIGGAIVGWFLFDPLTRLTYRLCFRAATPGALLFTTKASAGALLAFLIYNFMPLGGGGGGFGFGPGAGGAPGKGPGNGGANDNTLVKDGKTPSKDPSQPPVEKSDPHREFIEIEILGGTRFKDDGKLRYYFVKPSEKTMSYLELKDYFSEHKGKLSVRVTLTPESASFGTENDDPTRRLRRLMDTYDQNRESKSND